MLKLRVISLRVLWRGADGMVLETRELGLSH